MEDPSAFVAGVEAWAGLLAGDAAGLRPQALTLCGLPARIAERVVNSVPRVVGSWTGGEILVADRRLVFLARSNGVSARDASLPARVTHAIGLRGLVAAGGGFPVSAEAREAPCLIVSDHLNLRGDNPLVGPNHESWGVRFPDMSEPYDPALRGAGVMAGALEGILAEVPGSLTQVRGEDSGFPDGGLVALAASLGADALGQGIVPLAIASAHAGLPFAAVLNLASGDEAADESFLRVLATLLGG